MGQASRYPRLKQGRYGIRGVWKIVDDEKLFFGSGKEYRRFLHLKLLEKGGVIRDLKRQVKFKFVVNDRLITTLRVDATYVVVETGRKTVDEAKGPETPEYKIKRELFMALYGGEYDYIQV